MIPDWAAHLVLALAAVVAGALNVVAGGGSFLVLPVMIFLGLPPTVANGTNRIGILAQNATAAWGFHQHRLIEGGWLAITVVPSLAGAAVGTWAAIEIEDDAFRRALALIMVAVSLWTLWDPLARRPGRETGPRGRLGTLGTALLFFTIGVYGGFVQAGIGFLLLAAATLQGLDLVRGNALKVLVVLAYIPLSLAIFAWEGKVVWGLGLVLAAGHLAGAFLGVHLTVLKGHRWVQRVVTVAVIAFAVKLWFD